MSTEDPGLAIVLPPAVVDLIVDRLEARLCDRAQPSAEPWVGVPVVARHLGCEPHRIYDLVCRRDHSRIPHRKGGVAAAVPALTDRPLGRRRRRRVSAAAARPALRLVSAFPQEAAMPKPTTTKTKHPGIYRRSEKYLYTYRQAGRQRWGTAVSLDEARRAKRTITVQMHRLRRVPP